MPNPIELKDPGAELSYEFDWSAEQTTGVTLVSVTHSAPDPLVILTEYTDAPNWTSVVRIGGGVHGQLYVVSATAVLSSGDSIDGTFTLRVIEAANA